MLKRLFMFLMLGVIMSANSFAEDADIVISAETTAANCYDEPVGGITSGTVTYQAVYEAKKYKVTYATGDHGHMDPMGFSGAFENDAVYDSAYTIRGLGAYNAAVLNPKSGVVADTGYVFAGWVGTSDDTNYTSQPYSETQSFVWNIDGDLTLTAQWKPKEYKITYECGSVKDVATGQTIRIDGEAPADQNINFDASWRLADNPYKCQKDGYDFIGWNCNYNIADGKANDERDTNKPNYRLGVVGTNPTNGEPIYGIIYAENENDHYNVDGNVRCVASWKTHGYSVIYKAGQYGQGNDYEDDVAYNAPYTVKALYQTSSITAKPGYYFTKWYGDKLNAISGDASYAEGATVSAYLRKTDATLTAQWEKNVGKVEYWCGFGNKQIKSDSVSTDDDYKLYGDPTNDCVAEGRTFAGWSCNADIEAGAWEDKDYRYDPIRQIFDPNPTKVVVPENKGIIKCTASWREDKYTVTYTHGNNHGTGSDFVDDNNGQGYSYNENYTVLRNGSVNGLNMTANLGYEFGGWSCGTSFRFTHNVTCEAIWNPVECGIEYHLRVVSYKTSTQEDVTLANYMSPVPSSTYNIESNITLASPARSGYMFNGWHFDSLTGDPATSIIGSDRFDDTTGKCETITLYGELEESEYSLAYKACVDDGSNACSDVVDLTPYLTSSFKVYTQDVETSFPSQIVDFTETYEGKTVAGQYRFIKMSNSNIAWYTGQDKIGNSNYRRTKTTGWPEESATNWPNPKEVWTTVKNVYGVTYRCKADENDSSITGNPPTDNDKYVVGQDVTLKANNSCSKTGSNFTGWTCSVPGVENAAPNTSFTMPANDVVCTADFADKQYLVQYDCMINGVTTTPYISGGSYSEGGEVTLANYQALCGNNPNYTFTEWNCKNILGGERIWNNGAAANLMPAYNVLCRADLTPKAYTLTYDCGDGELQTGKTAEILGPYSYQSPYRATLLDNMCQKTGAEFTTWRCGGNSYAAGRTITLNADTTCTAQWNDTQYDVIYDCGAGQGTAPTDGKHTYGERVPAKANGANNCTNPGGTFKNQWICYGLEGDDNNEGVAIAAGTGSFVMPANTVNCVADWNAQVYNIVYNNVDEVDADWADGQNHPQTYTYGVVTSIGVPNRENYRFLGWCVGSNPCSSSSYTRNRNGYTISATQTGTVNLYAMWEANTYTITYKLRIKNSSENLRLVNDADKVTMPNNLTVYDVTTEQVDLNDPSKPFYTFGGWHTASTETADNTIEQVPISGVLENLTLYGTLTEKEYNVKYMGCLDNRPNINGNYICSEVVDLTPYLSDNGNFKAYTKANKADFPSQIGQFTETVDGKTVAERYKFVKFSNSNIGWYTSQSTIGNNSYRRTTTNGWPEDNAANWPVAKEVWTVIKDVYAVTYDCGEGSGVEPTDSTKYVYGDTVTTQQNMSYNCAKTGNDFEYWRCGNELVNAGETFTIVEDTTCTAQWEPNGYNVEYMPGDHGAFEEGVESAVIPQEYGTEHIMRTVEEVQITANTGYKFKKWSCKQNTSNAAVNIETRLDETTDESIEYITMPDDSVTCTAIWDPKHYTVTYDKGGHADSSVENYEDIDGATYGNRYSALAGGAQDSATGIYAVTGYKFMGWNTSANQEVSNWNGENPWEYDNNLTVYAAYVPNPHTITYDCNYQGVTPATSSDSVLFGASYELAGYDNCVVPGLMFVGWSCPGLPGNPSVAECGQDGCFMAGATGTYSIDSDVTCSAQWQPEVYRVSYDCTSNANAGSVAPVDEQEYAYGATVIVKDNVRVVNEETLPACVRTNYDFIGWDCHNSGETLNGGDEFTAYNSAKCVAQWDRTCCSNDKYLNTETGECSVCPAHSHVPAGASCPESCECDTGYVDNGNGCELKKYTVTYQLNGGQYKEDTQDMYLTEYGVTTPNTPEEGIPEPEWTGHVFMGWYLVNNNVVTNEEITVVPGDYYRANPQNITLRAKWTNAGEIRYFCSRSDEGTYRSKNGPIGEPTTALAAAEVCSCAASGKCTFNKWVCDDGKEYREETGFDLTGETQLVYTELKKCYADLTVNIEYKVYTVDEDNNTPEQQELVFVDGDVVFVNSLRPDQYSTGQTVYYPANITLPGYTFKGWYEVYEEHDANGYYFYNSTNSAPLNPIKKVTVHGKFIKNPEVVSCDSKVWLHVNDEKMCLYRDRPDRKPYLVIQKGNNRYYGYMTKRTDESDLTINADSEKKFHIETRHGTYNLHDLTAH